MEPRGLNLSDSGFPVNRKFPYSFFKYFHNGAERDDLFVVIAPLSLSLH